MDADTTVDVVLRPDPSRLGRYVANALQCELPHDMRRMRLWGAVNGSLASVEVVSMSLLFDREGTQELKLSSSGTWESQHPFPSQKISLSPAYPCVDLVAAGDGTEMPEALAISLTGSPRVTDLRELSNKEVFRSPLAPGVEVELVGGVAVIRPVDASAEE